MDMIFNDFEFHSANNMDPTLVSYADENQAIWLHNDKIAQERLRKYYEGLPDGTIIGAYAATAEARCFLALGIDPLRFKWIDLYLEYRCLTNWNNRLMYGKQLIDGKVVRTVPPPKNKWDMTEEERKKANMSKPQHGLAAACFKLLDVMIDTKEKDEVRDLILSKPKRFTEAQKQRILKYNQSDIKYLPELYAAILSEYMRLLKRKYDPERLHKEMFWRGEYAVRTAMMERVGYPVDVKKTRNFSNSVDKILYQVQKEINEAHPDVAPFELNKKDYRHTWKQKKTREWIVSKGLDKEWMRTDTNQLSLSLDAFKRFFDFRHNYPIDNLGAQFVRYLNLKQNLNGFSPTSKNSFWDYVGDDGRARPYFGIYGAQSSRSQPKATGFLFLKSAWMRALCSPPPGIGMGGIDFGSQEFLIMALESGDAKMIEAYHTGDPYMYFAKAAKAAPPEATKKSHAVIRDKFKGTTLSMQYDQTAKGMSQKLSNDLGYEVTEEECQKLIDLYYRVFGKVPTYKEAIQSFYQRNRYIKLPDGWYMWGDNPNFRSVGNVPIQGIGASIMRLAVKYAQEAKLTINMTLHDALYQEFLKEHMVKSMQTLAECMQGAFYEHYKNRYPRDVAMIRLDGNVWGPDFSDGEVDVPILGKVKTQTLYIDGRGKAEYDKFSKYFEDVDIEGIEL